MTTHTLAGIDDADGPDIFAGIDLSHLGESSADNRDIAADNCMMCRRELSRTVPVLRVAPDRFAHPECFSGLPLVLHPALIMELCIEDYGDRTWVCYYCNRPFVAQRRMLYCSTECKVDAVNERRRSALTTCTCTECGDTFRAARSDATTCTPRCRQRRARRIARESQVTASSADNCDNTGCDAK